MAIDSIESHRKHHRSPSADESPEKSKRSKHRHHRHHRHRHHRHRSKRDKAKKDEIESEVGIVDKSGDYDMEEGEILEEGEFVGTEAGIDDKIVVSDLESGELNDCDMRGVDAMEKSAMDYDTKSSKILKSLSDMSDDSKNCRSQASLDESPESVSIPNGDSSKISSKGGRSRGRSKSPLKSSDKRKDKHESESKDKIVKLMEEDGDEHGGRRNSHSRKTRNDSPPSNRSYHVETGDRSRPESVERLTEKQRSRSIVHEKHARSRHHRERDEGTYENDKVYDDIDEEREKASNKRRERSSSRHRSSMHGNSDSLDIKRDERISEQEPVRARSDRDWENERDRRGRDCERESDKEKAREAKRGVDWDRERDRDWENNREKDRGRSRDRDYERDRRRDASSSSFRDENLERGRIRDLETGRTRNSYQGRNRHDDGSDRSRRYGRYEEQVIGRGD